MSDFEDVWTSIRQYFDGRLVHRCQDPWGEIMVVDNRHLRVLTFGSIYEQSTQDMRKPHVLVHEYARAMMLVLAFINPRHATFLGLGGGSLVRSLFHLRPACELHVIELRQQVLQVARDYFGLPSVPSVTFTIADARLLLRDIPAASTDVIFADMYHSAEMNPFQRQKKFIQHCHRVLDESGWLVVNFHRLPDLNDPFFQWLGQQFPTLFLCPTPSGNQILLAGKVTVTELSALEPGLGLLEKPMGTRMIPLFRRLIRVQGE